MSGLDSLFEVAKFLISSNNEKKNYETTHVTMHDNQMIPHLIDETDNVVYADGAYWGKPVADSLFANVENRICERETKQQPLTAEQVAENRLISKIRCRIEHVFGFMTNSMYGLTLCSIELSAPISISGSPTCSTTFPLRIFML